MLRRNGIINNNNILKCIQYRLSGVSPSQKSFYKRTLPSELIALATPLGQRIFNESLQEGNCQAFFRLAQHFQTQLSVSTCGLASLAMILNALHVDPGYNWKGIWRWYDDFNIRTATEKQITHGVTLQEWNNIIANNATKSMAFSAKYKSESEGMNQSQNERRRIEDTTTTGIHYATLHGFRSFIQTCTRRSSTFLTCNYSRKALNQTGVGHFSPIAAYHSNRDLVLILDVARYKYQPHWCSVNTLWQAMKSIDIDSGVSRGFIINRKQQQQKWSALCAMEMDHQTNLLLKQKIKSGMGLLQIINDHTLHSLWIPILFQYATSQMNIGEGLKDEIGNLTEDCKVLLGGFDNGKVYQSLYLLKSILDMQNQHQKTNIDANVHKFIMLCRDYLQLR